MAMHFAIKAALLSGLVFPGAGQIYLKRVIRGIGYIIGTLIPMIIIVADLTKVATMALDNLAGRGGVIDMTTVSDAATHAAADASGFWINMMLVLMVGCWLVSTVDAFLLGRQRDRLALSEFKVPDQSGPPQPNQP
jgi:TM2 domain-containing membrane protein YozV